MWRPTPPLLRCTTEMTIIKPSNDSYSWLICLRFFFSCPFSSFVHICHSPHLVAIEIETPRDTRTHTRFKSPQNTTKQPTSFRCHSKLPPFKSTIGHRKSFMRRTQLLRLLILMKCGAVRQMRVSCLSYGARGQITAHQKYISFFIGRTNSKFPFGAGGGVCGEYAFYACASFVASRLLLWVCLFLAVFNFFFRLCAQRPYIPRLPNTIQRA